MNYQIDDLTNSVWFNQWAEWDDDNFNKQINKICDEIGIKGKKRKLIFPIIILNLWNSFRKDKTQYVHYYRNQHQYSLPKNYNNPICTKTTIKIIDKLKKESLIDHIKGSQFSGLVSRMRGKSKLFKLFEKNNLQLPTQIPFNQNEECIVLRKKISVKRTGKRDKYEYELLKYNQTKQVKQMRKDLIAYNNLLIRHFISIPDYPDKGIEREYYNPDTKEFYTQRRKLDCKDKFITRKFLRDFNHGGRFYGGFWQKTEKERRKHIFIDNQSTVEIDYSGFHILLLYGLEKLDYWTIHNEDVYSLPDSVMKSHYPEIKTDKQRNQFRELMKQVVLTTINSTDLKQSISSLRENITRTNKKEFGWFKTLYGTKEKNKFVLKDITIKELISLFMDKHKLIKNWFCSNKGAIVQNFDSHIASRVINYFTNEFHELSEDDDGNLIDEVPVLCVHDSFIIQSQWKDELIRIMTDSMIDFIKDKTGFQLRRSSIKKKITGEENILLKQLLDYRKYQNKLRNTKRSLNYIETRDYENWVKKEEKKWDVEKTLKSFDPSLVIPPFKFDASKYGIKIVGDEIFLGKELSGYYKNEEFETSNSWDLYKKVKKPKSYERIKFNNTYLRDRKEFLLFINNKNFNKNYYQ